MSTIKPDFRQDPNQENARGHNGNGNRLRDYRLDKLEERISNLETTVNEIKTAVTEIKASMITAKQLLYTVISIAVTLIGTIVVHVIIRSFFTNS